ncbi:hypothetical protein EDC96DRAFT_199204 [Choanephora cucurbitarum]|nr:hypothetical protein EDC96DRAFT_199204 [Choanephora cucurbitarum]
MSVLKNTSPSLPPISVFMQSNHIASSAMPASPPTSAFKSPPILPKPQITESVPSSTSPPDQQTLWLLFKQFQQYKSSNESEEHKTLSDSSPLSSKLTISKPMLTEKALSSEEVLAEKRRRNAGASARFRDRRKQRERELQEKCSTLEDRTKALENALKLIDPNHPLLAQTKAQGSTPTESQALSPSSNTEQNTLFDRVGQLEDMMYHFKQEKETDALKLDELERENKYLRSLLVPVTNRNIRSNTLKTKTALEKSEEYEASMNKRIRSS